MTLPGFPQGDYQFIKYTTRWHSFVTNQNIYAVHYLVPLKYPILIIEFFRYFTKDNYSKKNC